MTNIMLGRGGGSRGLCKRRRKIIWRVLCRLRLSAMFLAPETLPSHDTIAKATSEKRGILAAENSNHHGASAKETQDNKVKGQASSCWLSSYLQ